MSYSKYIVTFVDALGTKERAENFDESLKITSALSSAKQMMQEFIPDGFDRSLSNYEQKIIRFSDTLAIFSTLPSEIPECQEVYSSLDEFHASLFSLNLWNISLLQSLLFMQNILTRGAITMGNAFCDISQEEYFGPAFNRAYELESKFSVNPRVIIDPEIRNNKFFKDTLTDMEKFNTSIEKAGATGFRLVEDIDDFLYVDYFFPLENLKFNDNLINKLPRETYAIGITNISKLFLDKYNKLKEKKNISNSDLKILQKYSWVLKNIKEKNLLD